MGPFVPILSEVLFPGSPRLTGSIDFEVVKRTCNYNITRYSASQDMVPVILIVCLAMNQGF